MSGEGRRAYFCGKEYLPLVRNSLENTAMTTVRKTQLDDRIVDLDRQLVLATAWQESCRRQYVVRQRKLVPLRSTTPARLN